ncbi:MAG: hypothetical protein ACP6IQ_07450 [Candidatus Njordarchaeia archaeon]
MKVVIAFKGQTIVFKIDEKDIDKIIDYLESEYSGQIQYKSDFELIRYKFKKGVAIIYRDNRRVRTRNEWIELRSLFLLSQKLNLPFYHSVLFNFGKYQHEVDGVNFQERIMVEVLNRKLTNDWIEYYIKKMRRINFKKCIVIAKSTAKDIKIPEDMEVYIYKLNLSSLINYYKSLKFPSWVKSFLPKRHVRFLLSNGRWTGAKRRLSNTNKHTTEHKLWLELTRFFRRKRFPIKIYYSMARMINPAGEFFGRGYPLPYLLGVFDVDAATKNIPIDAKRYLYEIEKSTREKVKNVLETLESEGYKTKILFSGKKGFHIYAFDEDRPLEFKEENLRRLVLKLGNNIDNINFKSKEGTLDLHRIIKLPCSIDLSTGIPVSENYNRIVISDNLNKI